MENKKTKLKWTKCYDFMDNSPRYTFGGRDPSCALEDIEVVIYQEKEQEYFGGNKRKYYYGWVCHIPTETGDKIGRFKYLKDAKKETEKLFFEYVDIFKDRAISRYYLTQRPPAPGAIPGKPIRVKSFDSKKHIEEIGYAWGWVEYEEELTEKEVCDYELCRSQGC